MSQWADDSMTPPAISVSRDKYGNEIAADRSSHTEATPGKGGFAWGEGHYSDDWQGGYSSYGQSVSGSNSVERNSVDTSRADRGKES